MAAWIPLPGALAPWLDLLAHLPAALAHALRSLWHERVGTPLRRSAARRLAQLALWCATDAAVAVARPAVTVADLDTMPMPALVCPLPSLPVLTQPTPAVTRPVYSGLRPYALQLGYSPHAAAVPATTVLALARALLTLEHRGPLVDWQLPVVEHILDALLPLAAVADEALAERVAQQPSQPLAVDWLRQAQDEHARRQRQQQPSPDGGNGNGNDGKGAA